MDKYEELFCAEMKLLGQFGAQCGEAAKGAQSPKEAAKAVHAFLVKQAKAQGQSASEVALIAPGKESYLGVKDCWIVAWEAGPHEWAIPASMEIGGQWGHAEPYYGFDLMFYGA